MFKIERDKTEHGTNRFRGPNRFNYELPHATDPMCIMFYANFLLYLVLM